jgi:hypothetical protein
MRRGVRRCPAAAAAWETCTKEAGVRAPGTGVQTRQIGRGGEQSPPFSFFRHCERSDANTHAFAVIARFPSPARGPRQSRRVRLDCRVVWLRQAPRNDPTYLRHCERSEAISRHLVVRILMGGLGVAHLVSSRGPERSEEAVAISSRSAGLLRRLASPGSSQ